MGGPREVGNKILEIYPAPLPIPRPSVCCVTRPAIGLIFLGNFTVPTNVMVLRGRFPLDRLSLFPFCIWCSRVDKTDANWEQGVPHVLCTGAGKGMRWGKTMAGRGSWFSSFCFWYYPSRSMELDKLIERICKREGKT